MTKRMGLCMIAMAVVGLSLTGCMPKMTLEDLKAWEPERPPELDKLNMLAGEWESTGEARIPGIEEVQKGTSKSSATWECDKYYLVERTEHGMEDLDKMKSIGVWTYDPKSKKYLLWWFESTGETGSGTATYCESTKTWKVKAKGRSPWGNSFTEGTMSMVKDDTMEWTFRVRYGSIFAEPWEFKGTSKRK